jgi:hypothetical protein
MNKPLRSTASRPMIAPFGSQTGSSLPNPTKRNRLLYAGCSLSRRSGRMLHKAWSGSSHNSIFRQTDGPRKVRSSGSNRVDNRSSARSVRGRLLRNGPTASRIQPFQLQSCDHSPRLDARMCRMAERSELLAANRNRYRVRHGLGAAVVYPSAKRATARIHRSRYRVGKRSCADALGTRGVAGKKARRRKKDFVGAWLVVNPRNSRTLWRLSVDSYLQQSIRRRRDVADGQTDYTG